MRIAFLTWRDLTHPDGGGSEVFVEETARRLSERGHDVTILCARHGSAPHRESSGGVEILRRGGRLSVYPLGLAWAWRHRRGLDVVVDVVNGLPFATPLVRRRGTVALVHHLHREQWRLIYPGLWGRVGWFVESTVTPRLYRGLPFVTVSDVSRSDLVELGVPAGDISVVRNGVHVPPAGLPPRSAEPRIVVLARLVPHKQVEQVIRLAARLAPEVPGLRVDVIGEGWWRPELETELTRAGVEETVRLRGHLSDEDRDQLLAQAWVHVLPSVKEGWGLAIMESAAVGTPSVAYSFGGGVSESVVDGETGLLAHDFDELVAHTRRLLGDAQLRERMSQRAAERAATFTWESTTDALEQALVACLRTGRRS